MKNFNFMFGLIWSLFTTLCLSFFIIPIVSNPEAIFELWFVALFFLIFETIGIVLMVSGVKQMKRDRNTEKLGEETFGMIINILNTGAYINGRPQFKAEILTYMRHENALRKFEEIIGFDKDLYKIGDFLKLKYYENDVNIVEKIDGSQIPLDVFRSMQEELIDLDKVVINGEVYVKQK